MIVEFIGASGAGKSTLARALQSQAASKHVVSGWDLAMDRPGLRRITNPSVVNLILDIWSLPYFLRSWRRHREFVAFARRVLVDHSSSTFEKLNYSRSIMRRVGVYELARREAPDKIVLVDEGTVLAAHLLFVYVNPHANEGDMEQFAKLVPLPDRIVYVRAPVASMVDRAMSRPDRRRELRGRPDLTEQRIRRAVAVFDSLAASTAFEDRVQIVENFDTNIDDRDGAVQELAAVILDGVSASGSPQPKKGREAS